jgi:hypothetical protein
MGAKKTDQGDHDRATSYDPDQHDRGNGFGNRFLIKSCTTTSG